MKKILVNFFCWIDQLHWLWLGLAAPFLLFPGPKRSLVMLVVPGLWILHGFVVRCASPATQPFPRSLPVFPLTPLNLPILLMAIMVLVSTWATYDIAVSLPKISGLMLGFGVYFAVARQSRTTQGWWLSLYAFLSIGIGIAILGILGTQWVTAKLIFFNPLTARFPQLIAGLQGAEEGFHPNEVAGTLLWVLPIMVTVSVSLQTPETNKTPQAIKGESLSIYPDFMRAKWRIWALRLFLWSSTLFVFLVFVLTQSRSSYLALFAAALVLFLVALPWHGRFLLLGTTLILGLVLTIISLSGKREFLSAWLPDYLLLAWRSLRVNNTLGLRIEIWSRAVFALQDFSFTGMGMNTFRHVVHDFYPLFSISKDIGHAHNEFLQAALDLGIPGLIAFISLYNGAFWMLVRMWRRCSAFLLKGIILGLAGGLLAHMFYGLTDAVALGAKPGILFWMLLGLVAGLHTQITLSNNKT